MRIAIALFLLTFSINLQAGSIDLQAALEGFNKLNNGEVKQECSEDDMYPDSRSLVSSEGPTGSPNWYYHGPMPRLVGTRKIVISLKSHTLRITGYLPDDFKGKLPDYAHVEELYGKRWVQIVYPIATGTEDGNNAPGEYNDVRAMPYTPYNVAQNKVPWGGFPFIKYNRERGIAFHGPITANGNDWKLRRGPVSHGCNRMQGEHVTELAHIMGLDMTKEHQVHGVDLMYRTIVTEEYDVVGHGKLKGKTVDVDYPALKSVKRPTENVHMFSTWDGNKTQYVTESKPSYFGEVEYAATDRGDGRMHFKATTKGADKIELSVDRVEKPINVKEGSSTAEFDYLFNTPGQRKMTVVAYKEGKVISKRKFTFEIKPKKSKTVQKAQDSANVAGNNS
jgi:hypothetical protein